MPRRRAREREVMMREEARLTVLKAFWRRGSVRAKRARPE